ncbi:putative insecticidal toxin [Candidatus Paraburkholderia kirkii]|nr:putative insecticidal toxin [Candidatus Paraburkholderia kirkii]
MRTKPRLKRRTAARSLALTATLRCMMKTLTLAKNRRWNWLFLLQYCPPPLPSLIPLRPGLMRCPIFTVWRSGALAMAVSPGLLVPAAAGASHTAAERLSQSEAYRRRRQEWEIQRNAAQSEVNQIDAQLASLAVRREGAVLQKTYLETQQSQTQAQMTFLQNKFTSKALYNWLRGKLAAIYYQYYDLAVSRCLMAQEAYKWALGTGSSFIIRPGAWQGTYAGLMAGETLMLNLAQMEQRYLEKDQREKELTRTVSLSEVYAALSVSAFTLADEVTALVTAGKGSVGKDDNGLTVNDKQLQATLKLSDLNIGDDYPASLGNTRRIKQISVTLPALVGPYQDVRAVLSYGGSVKLPRAVRLPRYHPV